MGSLTLIESLSPWNPWWRVSRVPESLLGRVRHEAKEVLDDLEGPRAAVLTGIRRCGKTTLMYQVIQMLLEQGIHPHRVLYINLEDSTFDGFSLEEMVSAFRQEFSAPGPHYLFLDEVQTRKDWARYVRVVVDQKRHRIAITGSTSSLLAGRAGQLLTGRHATTQVHPLSYPAFLAFHGVQVPPAPLGKEDADHFVHQLDQYLERGGFPQPNLEDEARSQKTLRDYFSDILERDLVVAMDLDATRVRKLGAFLSRAPARPHTKSSLHRATGISRDAVRTYLEAFESSFLVQPCTRFVWSPKPQLAEQAPVKYYLADPGLRSTGTGRDRGRLAENVAANALYAHNGVLHYWRSDHHEVDFVLDAGEGRLDAWQVTYTDDVPEREVAALVALWDALGVSRRGRRAVLTRNREGEQEGVPLMPLWKWLLGQKT